MKVVEKVVEKNLTKTLKEMDNLYTIQSCFRPGSTETSLVVFVEAPPM